MDKSKDKDIYGPGTWTDQNLIFVPEDCRRLLRHLAAKTPGFTNDETLLSKVDFHGGDLPILPGPLKSQVLTAVVHGMLGVVLNEICTLRGLDTGKISIDTDHAGMFPATPVLVEIDGKGFIDISRDKIPAKVGANLDRGVLHSTPMRYRTWSIYPTKDPLVHYQLLSSMNPIGLLNIYGLDPGAAKSSDEAYAIIKAEIMKYSASELDQKHMEHGYCGQTCYSPAQWRSTMMGIELARHPLVNYKLVKAYDSLAQVPFSAASNNRPLAGIKVVELSRIIAAPATGMILAALGAEVIRIQPPHLHDIQILNVTLTAGKQTCGLNLNDPKDYDKVMRLISQADVVIQAFRMKSLERRGLGRDEIFELARRRGRGIVYVDLNCYGPDGYYAERPGYQQCADAASGCSYVCGKAYGFPEGTAVLPSLPIADMVCGLVGAVDVLLALRDRAMKGGSFYACAALTAVDTIQLEPEFGLYPPEVVNQIQDRYRFGKMTPDLMVEELLCLIFAAWSNSSDLTKREAYFSTFRDTPFGQSHRILAPALKFENEQLNPFWTHGPVPYCWTDEPQFS